MRTVKFEVVFEIDDDYKINSIEVESEKMVDVKKDRWKNTGNTYSVCITKCNGKTNLNKLIESLKIIEE